MTYTEFNSSEFELAYPDGIEHHYWTLARNQFLFDTLKRHSPASLLSETKSSEKILEIGCGKGVVVAYMRKHGLDCYGAELAGVSPIKGVEDFVLTNTDAASMAVSFGTREARSEGFHTIMLLDVIEHIQDPVVFIAAIKMAYPKARQFIFTVPARKELWSNYDQFYGHVMRYDASDMVDLMRAVDLEIVMQQYFFQLMYPLARLNNRCRGKRNVEIAAPRGAFLMAMHRIIASTLVFTSSILPKTLAGTSLLCVARSAPIRSKTTINDT